MFEFASVPCRLDPVTCQRYGVQQPPQHPRPSLDLSRSSRLTIPLLFHGGNLHARRAQLYSELHAFPKTSSPLLFADAARFARGCAAYKIFRILRRAHFLRLASRFSRRHVRGLSAATRRGAARTDAVASRPERREKASGRSFLRAAE